MPDPITVAHEPPSEGLFAVGIDAEEWCGSPTFEPHPPAWATAMAEERCDACCGTGTVTTFDEGGWAHQDYSHCPECIDGRPLRDVRIECRCWAGDQTDLNAGPLNGCLTCGNSGHRSIGSAAVLACVPVERIMPRADSGPRQFNVDHNRVTYHPLTGGGCHYWKDGNGLPIHFPDASSYLGGFALICKAAP